MDSASIMPTPPPLSSVPSRQEEKVIFVQQVKDLVANEDLADFNLVVHTKRTFEVIPRFKGPLPLLY
jgi:hypothetical protein